MTTISQREARRLRKEVARLTGIIRAQRRTWSQEYIGGIHLQTVPWQPNDSVPVSIRTARSLGHAVVCMCDETGQVRFIALPHPKVDA